MWVLSRKKNESIVFNNDIVVSVMEVRGDKIRLGIVAPKDCPFDRVSKGTASKYRPGELDQQVGIRQTG